MPPTKHQKQQQEDNNHEPNKYFNDLQPMVSVIQETSEKDYQA